MPPSVFGNIIELGRCYIYIVSLFFTSKVSHARLIVGGAENESTYMGCYNENRKIGELTKGVYRRLRRRVRGATDAYKTTGRKIRDQPGALGAMRTVGRHAKLEEAAWRYSCLFWCSLCFFVSKCGAPHENAKGRFLLGNIGEAMGERRELDMHVRSRRREETCLFFNLRDGSGGRLLCRLHHFVCFSLFLSLGLSWAATTVDRWALLFWFPCDACRQNVVLPPRSTM